MNDSSYRPINIFPGRSSISDQHISVDANDVYVDGMTLKSQIDTLKYGLKRYSSVFLEDPNPAIDVAFLNQMESGEEVEFKLAYELWLFRGKLWKDNYRIYIAQESPYYRTLEIIKFDWLPLTDEKVSWKDAAITMLRRYTPKLEILGEPVAGAVIAINADGKQEWKIPEPPEPPAPKKKDIFSMDDYLS